MSAAARALIIAAPLAFTAAGLGQPASRVASGTSDEPTLTVEASPMHLAVGDRLTIRLLVHLPNDGCRVRFPVIDAFGDLRPRVETPAFQRPTSAGRVWQQSYTCEPLKSGTLEIPPLTVTCAPTRDDSQAAVDLTSDPLIVTVRSAVTAGDDPRRPRDITAPVSLTKPPRPLWQSGFLLLVLLTALALAHAVLRARPRTAAAPAEPTPEARALAAIDRLARARQISAGRTRTLYYSLTEIVRVFAERKLGLSAAQMTSEEFLARLAREPDPTLCNIDRLRAFLHACDMVRYAALQPQQTEVDATLSAARAFVNETAAAANARPAATGVQAA